mmetsp:Transcript_16487/g.27996  ORF Transcript_16487/g.27996 Transcript_16487/m.27996 type:complete len:168 (+) Transcript_16487:1162-1665(+)
MVVVWVSASFGYYLISYQLKYIKGDIFINGIISSSSEILAYLVSGYLASILGVKRVLLFSYLLAFAGMFCILVTQTDDQLLLALFILGSKYGISQVFNIAYVGNVLVFPTNIVGTTFGICNIFARFSTILSPFVAELKPDTISQVVFCVIVVVAFFSSLFLQVNKSA